MSGLGSDKNVRQIQNCRPWWIERIPNTAHNYLKVFEIISRPYSIIHTEPKMKISECNADIFLDTLADNFAKALVCSILGCFLECQHTVH